MVAAAYGYLSRLQSALPGTWLHRVFALCVLPSYQLLQDCILLAMLQLVALEGIESIRCVGILWIVEHLEVNCCHFCCTTVCKRLAVAFGVVTENWHGICSDSGLWVPSIWQDLEVNHNILSHFIWRHYAEFNHLSLLVHWLLGSMRKKIPLAWGSGTWRQHLRFNLLWFLGYT